MLNRPGSSVQALQIHSNGFGPCSFFSRGAWSAQLASAVGIGEAAAEIRIAHASGCASNIRCIWPEWQEIFPLNGGHFSAAQRGFTHRALAARNWRFHNGLRADLLRCRETPDSRRCEWLHPSLMHSHFVSAEKVRCPPSVSSVANGP
jgi:hypothetical protein